MAYLEEYSAHPAKALRQAKDLAELIAGDRDWLEEWRPGLVERYADRRHAFANVIRLATTSSDFEAYIARERQHTIAKGIVTVIRNVQVVHPEVGIISGDDVDYWLTAGASPELHDSVAASAMYAGAKPHIGVGDGWQYVMATVEVDHPHPPIGLVNPANISVVPRLEPIGEPAVLSLPEGQEDIYGLTKGGKVLQLYYGEGPVQERNDL